MNLSWVLHDGPNEVVDRVLRRDDFVGVAVDQAFAFVSRPIDLAETYQRLTRAKTNWDVGQSAQRQEFADHTATERDIAVDARDAFQGQFRRPEDQRDR